MGRGDQPVAGDGSTEDPNGLEARNNLVLAAADGGQQPQTWSRNDGGRYFDAWPGSGGNGDGGLQPGDGGPQPGVDRPQQAGQAQWTEIPTIGGNTVRIDPQGNMVRITDQSGKLLGSGRLNRGEPTPIMIGEVRILVNPDRTVDIPSESGLTRNYPTGVSEYYDRIDNTYRINNRQFPDGSYEKYLNGRLSETNYNGFITIFDEFSRKTEVSTPQGDRYRFRYGASGQVDSYDLTRINERNESQLLERGAKGPDGYLRIERRQPDGTMRLDDRLINRADVALRSDLKLDYLDKDGYSLPDANGRMIKRDDRTVMAAAESGDGTMAPYPVNPIRSIRLQDGRQIDYEYASDKFRGRGQSQQGADGLLSYTVRDRTGRAVEFGQKIAEIPDAQRTSNTGWLEYRAPRGESLPEDQIDKVKQLSLPADPTRLNDPQERARIRQEMTNARTRLVQDKPMKDFMPKQLPGETGRETVDVAIDQLTGKQFNLYANGSTRVRNERGQEFIATFDQNTGDSFETYGDGTTFRRPWDADSRKHPLDRTTITVPNADGVPRVELHHSRKDNSFFDVNYDNTGRVPTEVILTPQGGQPIKMAPAENDPTSWLEYKREGNTWQPTGRAFQMRVDLIGRDDVRVTNEGKQLPAGTIVISQRDKRRIITPAGEEIVGRTGSTPADTIPDKDGRYLTPPFPQRVDTQPVAPSNWRPPNTRQDGRPKEPPQQPPRHPDRPPLRPKR